jgi:uncharacterized protein YndB with AHSA1/START domain/uncharacterized protein YciI
MKLRLRSLAWPVLGFLLAIAGTPALSFAEGDSTMHQPQHFFGRLLGTRPTWPGDMTEAEGKIMSEHFVRLKKFVMAKKVLMAGPCFGDPVFGLCILRVDSEAEAREIMSNDPAVKAGLMTFDLAPLTLSLMADNRPKYRYAENPSDRILHVEVVAKGTPSEIWPMWTTNEGLRSFFAEDCNVELRPGGPFEIYFSKTEPYGQRGSEDCKVLSYLPNRLLSFEWNAPPKFGEIRDIRTIINVQLTPVGSDSTRVTLDQLGWGTGDNWDSLHDYFDKAWHFVLENLKKTVESK